MNLVESSNNFKNKRDQFLIEIRRKKHDDFVSSKRAKLGLGRGNNHDQGEEKNDMQTDNQTAERLLTEHCRALRHAVKDDKQDVILESLTAIRRLISDSDEPPIEAIIKYDIGHYFTGLIENPTEENKQIVFETSWILANLCLDYSYSKILINEHLLSRAIKLLENPDEGIRDNAIYIFANMCADSDSTRSELIENRKFIEKIIKCFYAFPYNFEYLQHFTWLLTQLTRKDYPNFYEVVGLLDIVKDVLHINHDPSLLNILTVLSNLTEGEEGQIQLVLELGVAKRVIELMKSQDIGVAVYATRSIGNMLTGSDEQVDELIEAGVIEALAPLLDSSNKLLRRDAAWCIGHILAGSCSQVEEVFDFEHGKIIRCMLTMVLRDELKIQHEAIFALMNLFNSATLERVQYMVDNGIIQMIFEKLNETMEYDVINNCVRGLSSIFDAGKPVEEISHSQNPYLIEAFKCNGNQVLEKLLSHPDDHVYELIDDFVSKYFETSDQ